MSQGSFDNEEVFGRRARSECSAGDDKAVAELARDNRGATSGRRAQGLNDCSSARLDCREGDLGENARHRLGNAMTSDHPRDATRR